MNSNRSSDEPGVFDYRGLRRVIGILGVAFPVALTLGAWVFFRSRVQSSISAYYWTGMRDVFVGTLWAIGFFMLSYRGYPREKEWISDETASNLACVFAVVTALFATDPTGAASQPAWVGRVHWTFAALFFGMMIYFALFLFTKSKSGADMSPQKKRRNTIYRAAGGIMAACVTLIAVYMLLPESVSSLFDRWRPVFWLELVATELFGFAWLVKGELIPFLNDPASA